MHTLFFTVNDHTPIEYLITSETKPTLVIFDKVHILSLSFMVPKNFGVLYCSYVLTTASSSV